MPIYFPSSNVGVDFSVHSGMSIIIIFPIFTNLVSKMTNYFYLTFLMTKGKHHSYSLTGYFLLLCDLLIDISCPLFYCNLFFLVCKSSLYNSPLSLKLIYIICLIVLFKVIFYVQIFFNLYIFAQKQNALGIPNYWNVTSYICMIFSTGYFIICFHIFSEHELLEGTSHDIFQFPHTN